MNKTKDIAKLLVIGEDFMEIMEDYEERQNDDPNFDPRTQLHDLYDNLVELYNHHSNE